LTVINVNRKVKFQAVILVGYKK